MLVDLHVEVTPPVLINALVFTSANAEESELAICVPVAQAATEKPVVVVDPETRVGCGRKDSLQLVTEGVVDVLVSVEEEDPRSFDMVVAEVPVALLGEVAVPTEVNPFGTRLAHNSPRVIRGSRVNHHHPAESPKQR
jgi:hypothetical protein